MPIKDVEARRAYDREWKAARRRRFLEGKSCRDCGSADHLQFHHLDPSEKTSHRIWGWSVPRIEAELAKCVVLCKGCHDGLHATDRRLDCGAAAGYWRGCRCEPCRVARSVYEARRRSGLPAKEVTA